MKTLLNRMAVQMFSVLLLLAIGQAQAHILNEASQFPDIKDTDARFDIVLLVGAGVIPETPQFEPEKNLTRTDLAAWAAQTAGLLKSADKPDIKALASAALDQGLVTTLEGDATYADINTVFMQGKGATAEANAVPTRAKAASYLAVGLVSPVAGSLLEKTAVVPGPTGVVSGVESKTNPDGGSSQFLAIGDTSLPVYTHAKVGNGSSSLAKWKGLTVRRSFIRKMGDISVWLYLEADTVAGQTAEPAHDHSTHKHAE
jgi:hypothetical protein